MKEHELCDVRLLVISVIIAYKSVIDQGIDTEHGGNCSYNHVSHLLMEHSWFCSLLVCFITGKNMKTVSVHFGYELLWKSRG